MTVTVGGGATAWVTVWVGISSLGVVIVVVVVVGPLPVVEPQAARVNPAAPIKAATTIDRRIRRSRSRPQ